MADFSRRAGDALRALVAAGRIKSAWVPGMRAIEPGRERGARTCRDDDRMGTLARFLYHGALPDPDDPLTVFGLLLLAREAWGEPGLYVGTADGWYVTVPDSAAPWGGRVLTGATEAEAIVAALEAAVEAGRG